MQSNLVISLGMVGALSIVRFRTAIKDPMDLVFMFWSISIGIICGAGLYEVALVTSVAVTVFILVLDMIPDVYKRQGQQNGLPTACHLSFLRNLKIY